MKKNGILAFVLALLAVALFQAIVPFFFLSMLLLESTFWLAPLALMFGFLVAQTSIFICGKLLNLGFYSRIFMQALSWGLFIYFAATIYHISKA